MIFGRILIIINVVLFVALALWMLVSPTLLLANLGVASLTASGAIELQVLVSGSFLAFAFIVVRGCVAESHTRRSLGQLIIIYAGWLVVRIVAMVQATPDDPITWIYLAFEIVMLLLLGVGLRFATPRHDRDLFASEDRGI
jgi:hypothetical protein